MKTDLRLTDTNAASDSKGRTWGLEGGLFWWLTDTALGTIRSLEANVQSFEERASKFDCDITDATKRAKELETKVGTHFEREERYQQLTRRQSEIEEKLDLTKNQAPSQVEAAESNEPNNINEQSKNVQRETTKPKRGIKV